MNSFEQNEERIKADVNTVIQSMANGQPDTAKLREAGSDILSTAASLLSNAGIDGLTGNGVPSAIEGDGAAAEEAGGIFKKLRDGLGLNGNALDEIRHAADQLKNNL
jgi:hypothetical protein